MLVVTCLLYGWLNHVMFLNLAFFLFYLWNCDCCHFLLLLCIRSYGHSHLSLVHLGTVVLLYMTMLSLDEIFDSHQLILSMVFLMMLCGWLLCLCSYSVVLFGFIYIVAISGLQIHCYAKEIYYLDVGSNCDIEFVFTEHVTYSFLGLFGMPWYFVTYYYPIISVKSYVYS